MSFNQKNDHIKKLKKEKSMDEADPDGDPKQSSHLQLNQTQQKKSSSSKASKELPNYMKPTNRFDANKDKFQVSTNSISSKIKSLNNTENPNCSKSAYSSDLVRNSGLKPVKSSMKKNSGVGIHPTVSITRNTCSSTAKIARNSESLDLYEPDRASHCTYKYCSLHGQKKHEVPLPAIKCFLSAKKQSIKSTNSFKQMEQSSTRKKSPKEVYSKPQEEKVQGEVEIVLRKTNQLQESYSVTSFEDYNSEISIEEIDVLDEPIKYNEDENQEETHLETEEGKLGYVDSEEKRGMHLQSLSNSTECFDDFLGKKLYNNIERRVEDCNLTMREENSASTSKHAGADSKLSTEVEDVKVENEVQQSKTFSYASEVESNESLQSGVELPNSPNEQPEEDLKNLKFHCENENDLKDDVENYDRNGDIQDGLEKEENVINSTPFISENPLKEMTNRSKEKYNTMRQITHENQENVRKFNQRSIEQESEVVNLKHQTLEERKRAEEWMIDYTLRNTIRRMAPARKRKVALLVAAFESIIQQEQGTTML